METFSALLAICARNSPVPGEFPHKGQWRWALMFSLTCVWINGWVNSREACNLRRYRVHYNVTVMTSTAAAQQETITPMSMPNFSNSLRTRTPIYRQSPPCLLIYSRTISGNNRRYCTVYTILLNITKLYAAKLGQQMEALYCTMRVQMSEFRYYTIQFHILASMRDTDPEITERQHEASIEGSRLQRVWFVAPGW